jgi:hypothetical protein
MRLRRTVLLLRPDQIKKLHTLAKLAKVSSAEIHRRAIDYYPETQEDLEMLNALSESLIKSNEEARIALEKAEIALSKALSSI